MPDGGRLTIETANSSVDTANARARDMQAGQYVAICVTDTGAGMSPQVLARAFDPFFTTKPTGQGTGLGLSMVYGFAKQSGGQVRLYSEVGHGTTVRLYLPRHSGDMNEEVDPQRRELVPHAEADETVLLVDDEATIRMVVTDVLTELGYSVIEASDSAAGLRVLQSDVQDRSADHRCRSAGRPERSSDGRCRPRETPRTEGALHHRLCRECRDRQRSPAPRHARAGQAFRDGAAGVSHQIHHCRRLNFTRWISTSSMRLIRLIKRRANGLNQLLSPVRLVEPLAVQAVQKLLTTSKIRIS